jgi:hypothetical protein
VRSESQWWELHRAAETSGRPWAEQLAEAVPAIVDVSGIVEAAGPSEDLVLSACHYAPNSFRIAGPDDLAVISWEHAGAMQPRWDLGGTLEAWSGGIDDSVNVAAAKALIEGYAQHVDVPAPLDLGLFSASVCGSLSWLTSRIRIALTEPDPERRELAESAVPWLLVHLPSRRRFQAVLDAVG